MENLKIWNLPKMAFLKRNHFFKRNQSLLFIVFQPLAIPSLLCFFSFMLICLCCDSFYVYSFSKVSTFDKLCSPILLLQQIHLHPRLQLCSLWMLSTRTSSNNSSFQNYRSVFTVLIGQFHLTISLYTYINKHVND